jgi:hypothetical protein
MIEDVSFAVSCVNLLYNGLSNHATCVPIVYNCVLSQLEVVKKML